MAHNLVILLLVTTVAIGCHCQELPSGGNLWAILVAGSNGYGNYRHQADVCHAYQVLIEHGMPTENIITMMYDDIAYNPENPFKGQIINSVDGYDVYEGVFIDYRGEEVNSTNFIKILTGDRDGMKGIGSGRVLESGPNDHVFINFVDHGADYLLAFPNDTDQLFAPDLLKAFMEMSENQKFGKMVVYIEACESGSMFDTFLSDKLNIFAVTAAKRNQDSYACCWDNTLQTYLGDVFSVNWMDDSDFENLQEETLSQQYNIIVQETNTSNPQEYGTLSVGRLPVGQFLGMRKFSKYSQKPVRDCEDAVSSRNVPIAVLQRKLEMAEMPNEKKELQDQIRTVFKLRRSVDNAMEQLLLYVYGNTQQKFINYLLSARTELSLEKFPCYKRLVHFWFKNCYGHSTSPYGLQKLHVFSNMCMDNSDAVEHMMRAMRNICPNINVKEGIL